MFDSLIKSLSKTDISTTSSFSVVLFILKLRWYKVYIKGTLPFVDNSLKKYQNLQELFRSWNLCNSPGISDYNVFPFNSFKRIA